MDNKKQNVPADQSSTAGAAKGGITNIDSLTVWTSRDVSDLFPVEQHEFFLKTDVEPLLSAAEQPTGDLTDERAQFEAWIANKFPLAPQDDAGMRFERDGDEYFSCAVQDRWEAWQARAAIASYLASQPKAEQAPVAQADREHDLLQALRQVTNAALPVTNIAYNLGQSHEQWPGIQSSIRALDEARRDAFEVIRAVTAAPTITTASAQTWDVVALAVDEAEKHGLDYVKTELLRKLLARTRPEASAQTAPGKVRDRALEEAAKACVAERVVNTGDDTDIAYNMAIAHCAKAIRALKGQTGAATEGGKDA